MYNPRLELSGDGHLALYVPGIDGTGSLFYRQRVLLEAAGYRVATYRLRDAAPTMQVLVDDLGAVIDSAGTATVTLVGESFGGALSMSFAVTHPDRVSHLVVLNSFPFFRPQFRLRLALAGLSIIPWKTMALVRRVTASRLHSRHTTKREMRRFLELTKSTSRTGYLNRLRILMNYDVRGELPHLPVPTLFLAADRDRFIPSVKQGRLMKGLTPDAQLRVLEGHGHICLIAPDFDLAALITQWLATLHGTPSSTEVASGGNSS